MPSYCVDKATNPNGDHEVHDVSAGRWCLPVPANRQDLGTHGNCWPAMKLARTHFVQVTACRWCAAQCRAS